MENSILPHNQEFSDSNPTSIKKRQWRKFLLILCIVLVAGTLLTVGRVSFTFQRIYSKSNIEAVLKKLQEEEGFRPARDSDRVNYLLLGIRGINDPEGGLLTDGILVASIKKSSSQVALISIPRDLWVRMPGRRVYDKINAAYALGFAEGGSDLALAYAESVVERVTGLAIDGVASFNLVAIRELIDEVGGISVTLDRPFVENQQWIRGGDMGASKAFALETLKVPVIEKEVQPADAMTPLPSVAGDTQSASTVYQEIQRWVFYLPKGTQILDGTTALYYMRARYSSNDFDRERREQQILFALRDKIQSLGILLKPLRLNKLLGTVERNIATDIPAARIPELARLVAKDDTQELKHLVFSTNADGYLKAGRENGLYILLPISGTYEEMRRACKDVFVN